MSNITQLRYNPVLLAANTTYKAPSGSPSSIGGFLCSVAGTLTVTNSEGVTVINAQPVAAGLFHPMPFYIGPGFTVVLAGGAAGTLGVC